MAQEKFDNPAVCSQVNLVLVGERGDRNMDYAAKCRGRGSRRHGQRLY